MAVPGLMGALQEEFASGLSPARGQGSRALSELLSGLVVTPRQDAVAHRGQEHREWCICQGRLKDVAGTVPHLPFSATQTPDGGRAGKTA